MSTLTLRYHKGYFVVSGPDTQPTRFSSRREAKNWCHTQHPGSPIHEIGADASKRVVAVPKGRPKARKAE